MVSGLVDVGVEIGVEEAFIEKRHGNSRHNEATGDGGRATTRGVGGQLGGSRVECLPGCSSTFRVG
jgi:hypothetical protein